MDFDAVSLLLLFGTGGLVLVEAWVALRTRHRKYGIAMVCSSALLLCGVTLSTVSSTGFDASSTSVLLVGAGFAVTALGTIRRLTTHTRA